MISKVTLKDFQNHENLELEFDKFTTLTGGSNGGKTAVLRAILALVRNDSVADYVRYGQKTLAVTIEFDDGYIVEWNKGEKTNKYILTDPDGTSKTFDKVGDKAPDEVREVLQLGPIAIKGSEKEYVNFHTQLEAPFLISATPGTVAKIFGELTSASQLYTAVGEGNRQARSVNSLRNTRKADLDDAKGNLDEYKDLDEQQRLLQVGSDKYQSAIDVDAEINSCSATLERLESVTKASAELVPAIASLTAPAEVSFTALEELSSECAALSNLISSVEECEPRVAHLRSAIDSLKNVDSVNLADLDNINARIGLVTQYVDGIDSLKRRASEIKVLADRQAEDCDALDAQIDALFNELSSCPECEQELTDEAKVALIEGRAAHATH